EPRTVSSKRRNAAKSSSLLHRSIPDHRAHGIFYRLQTPAQWRAGAPGIGKNAGAIAVATMPQSGGDPARVPSLGSRMVDVRALAPLAVRNEHGLVRDRSSRPVHVGGRFLLLSRSFRGFVLCRLHRVLTDFLRGLIMLRRKILRALLQLVAGLA